jgi:periplasmic protein TonB
MMHYAQRRSPSSNAVGIGLVALLHLGLGYALITGLGSQFKRTAPAVTPVIYIDAPKPVEEPPIPIKTVVFQEVHSVFIPTPIIIEHRPDNPPIVTGTSDAPEDRDVAFHPAAPPVADTAVGAKRLDGVLPEYPARMLTLGREGWVNVQCDVDERGRTSQCTVLDSFGGNSFVENALAYVASAQYKPATHNGVPVTEPHHRFHIDFKINQ